MLEAFLPDLRAMAARLSYQLGAPLYAPYEDRKDSFSSPAQQMTAEEIAGFLKGPWAARLACIRPDGLPHVIPVWQEWDGACFYLVAWKGSFWAEHVLQNPNISLTVDEPWPPLRRIVARGHAHALDEGEQAGVIKGLVQRLTHRYLGKSAPLGEQAGQVFRIKPSYLRGWQGTPWQDAA
jgi:nitroimidazol reductase NimA-like FMN-containing flavoprotein (pyridoxamine 5'-phosphate oxidase superfamily)